LRSCVFLNWLKYGFDSVLGRLGHFEKGGFCKEIMNKYEDQKASSEVKRGIKTIFNQFRNKHARYAISASMLKLKDEGIMSMTVKKRIRKSHYLYFEYRCIFPFLYSSTARESMYDSNWIPSVATPEQHWNFPV